MLQVRSKGEFSLDFFRTFTSLSYRTLKVIHIFNSRTAAFKELVKVLLHGFKDPKSIENLAFYKVTNKKVKRFRCFSLVFSFPSSSSNFIKTVFVQLKLSYLKSQAVNLQITQQSLELKHFSRTNQQKTSFKAC